MPINKYGAPGISPLKFYPAITLFEIEILFPGKYSLVAFVYRFNKISPTNCEQSPLD